MGRATQEVRATPRESLWIAGRRRAVAGATICSTAQQVRLDDTRIWPRFVQDHLAELSRLTGDNPTQQRDWAALKSAVQNRLDEMASAVAAYQRYGLRPHGRCLAKAVLSSGTEDVRIITERMTPSKPRCLAPRQAAAATSVAPR